MCLISGLPKGQPAALGIQHVLMIYAGCARCAAHRNQHHHLGANGAKHDEAAIIAAAKQAKAH